MILYVLRRDWAPTELGADNDIMTYKEAQIYMERMAGRGSILGLTPITQLLRRLDNPQNKLQVIHVAGTNGKGSTCTFLEYLYREEGKRVGRYISPALHCYLERFQIDGHNMEEQEFAGLLSYVVSRIEDMEQAGEELPTAFEIETAIAFQYFAEQQVDIVILETGMGGRLDATNVVDHPLCTVFTSIGMDHMQFLGDTLEQIAYEKAGIIKTGCPVISYPNSLPVIKVLEQQYSLHNVCETEQPGFRVVQEEDIIILSETREGSTFQYKGTEYEIRMTGRHQIYNAVTAIETKLCLDGALIKEGLRNAYMEGRFDTVSEHPLIIRDGAHNADGAAMLKKSLEKHFTNEKLIFIIGVLRDKEYDKMMAVLCPFAERVFTITPDHERGLSAEVLRDSILPYCDAVEACSSVQEALNRAKQEHDLLYAKGERAVIIAWGSLSYIGQLGTGCTAVNRTGYGTSRTNYEASALSNTSDAD